MNKYELEQMKTYSLTDFCYHYDNDEDDTMTDFNDNSTDNNCSCLR